MQELLEAQEERLDVCVASASVGPAPAGETELHWPQPFMEASLPCCVSSTSLELWLLNAANAQLCSLHHRQDNHLCLRQGFQKRCLEQEIMT